MKMETVEMLMTANPQLTPKEIKLLEEAISGGQYDKIRLYADDAVNCHSKDIPELHRRRMFIARSTKGHSDGVYSFAILSALCDDVNGWDAAVKYFGEEIDPGFGFLVYRFVLQFNGEPEMLNRWGFLLEHSKSMGHLESIALIWEQKLSILGPLRLPFMMLIRIWLALRGGLMMIVDFDDPRLPKRSSNK